MDKFNSHAVVQFRDGTRQVIQPSAAFDGQWSELVKTVCKDYKKFDIIKS